MKVKKIGNDVENKFQKYMHEKGYWVYRVPDKLNGQPFDFICAKGNEIFCFDAKHIEKEGRFYTRRIEENQRNAFDLLNHFGCTNTFIACNFDNEDEFYFFRYRDDLGGSVKREDMVSYEYFKDEKKGSQI